MADPTTRPAPLRVRLDGPRALHAKAEWALEALLARARVVDWVRVGDGLDADLAWGRPGTAPHVLPLDESSWTFAWDREPDVDRDPLAVTFWWLARVEELLAPDDAFDEHGRFRFASSALARRATPYEVPVDDIAVDLWNDLAAWRAEPGDDDPTPRIVATHDIDVPWRWTRAGRRRALRAVRDDLRRRRPGRVARTVAALLAGLLPWRRDPWDNFQRIADLEASLGAESTSYLLVGRTTPEDGDAELHDRARGYVPRGIDPGDRVGVHGSYAASDTPGLLAEEFAEVARRTGAPRPDHRFHYLRHRPADAWPLLEQVGTRSDSSLGYAEQPGFRAGTAHPFRAWHHAEDRAIDVVIIPLVLMDASFDERHLDLPRWSDRWVVIGDVLDSVAHGSVSVLVHNDRLCNLADDGWTRAWKRLLRRHPLERGVVCTAGEAAEAYLALVPAHRRGA